MTQPKVAAARSAGVDLDHTSFVVHDARARRLRRQLGATPIAGEVLDEFRYLLLYVGTAEEGGRLELLEPVKPGFVTRFLSTRGEGPHHVTFTGSDLRHTVTRLRSLGQRVVGENYSHAPWCEAFIVPDDKHPVVIQLAQSDRTYPRPRELLASRTRDTASFPSTSGATDPLWWTSLWDTTPDAIARLGMTHLASTDLVLSRSIFEGVLDAQVRRVHDALDFWWLDTSSPCNRRSRSPGHEPAGRPRRRLGDRLRSRRNALVSARRAASRRTRSPHTC